MKNTQVEEEMDIGTSPSKMYKSAISKELTDQCLNQKQQIRPISEERLLTRHLEFRNGRKQMKQFYSVKLSEPNLVRLCEHESCRRMRYFHRLRDMRAHHDSTEPADDPDDMISGPAGCSLKKRIRLGRIFD